MKHRTLALILALVLVCSLLAGCGKTQQSAEEPAEGAAGETVEETVDEQPTETPEEQPAETPEESEEQPAEEPEEQPAEEPAFTVSYPMEGNEKVSGWFSFFGGLNTMPGFFTDSDYDEMFIIPYLEEGAGVDLDMITVSDTIASEQFKLMIASGDWPDYCGSFGSMYSGGLLQAYEDECIQSFTDEELQQYTPDYWKIRGALTGDDLAAALEHHMNLGVYTISSKSMDEQGMVTRADWYSEQGSPEITTLDEFTDYLYACYNAYQGDSTLHMEEGGSPGYIDDAFGVTIPSYAGSSVPYYVDNGEIKSNLTADGYYDYLQWFRKLYADGIINSEFYTRSMMTYQRLSYVASGEIAVWPCNAGSVHDQNRFLSEGQANIDTVPLSVITDDGVNDWGMKRSVVTNCYTVSADCDHTETVLGFMNYLYTEQGILYGNYGVEGVTYELDDNGDPCFTDLIINNEFGTMPENVVRAYIDEVFPVYRIADRLWGTYDEDMLAAATLWTGTETKYDHSYPTAAGLTTDEQNSITNDSADIMTYVSTEILSFLTGNKELNEETWAAFCAQLEEIGLSDVLAVYQNAYDQTMAGER